MRTPIVGNLVQWTTRITLRRNVQEAVRALAAEEARSTAAMIGVLLGEALTARSTA
jgi:hypothetical protein